MTDRAEVIRRINEMQRQKRSLPDAIAQALREFGLKRVPPRRVSARKLRGRSHPFGGSRRHGLVRVSPEDYAAAFDCAITDARAGGFTGDPESVRHLFDRRYAEWIAFLEDLEAEKERGRVELLRAIADAGGIGFDPMFHREIQRLWGRSKCQTPSTWRRQSRRGMVRISRGCQAANGS